MLAALAQNTTPIRKNIPVDTFSTFRNGFLICYGADLNAIGDRLFSSIWPVLR